MSIATDLVEYTHDGKTFEAYVAHDGSGKPKPVVMICHAWAGRAAHEEEAARKIAELGYVGFAADVYGKGVLGTSTEENQALMEPLASNRPFLQERLMTAYGAAKGLAYVDDSKTAVSGYCFGGLCTLDMARINSGVLGAAAFHAILAGPGNTAKQVDAKVIAFHGWDDPMATPENVLEFSKEMTDAKADWQLHAYGRTLHAFTNKEANNPDFGTVYSAEADRRSWAAFTDFLAEVF